MADQKEPAKDVPADAQSEGYKKLMEAIKAFKGGKDLGPLPLNLKMNWNTDDEWCPYYYKASIFVDENTSDGEGSDNRGALKKQKK